VSRGPGCRAGWPGFHWPGFPCQLVGMGFGWSGGVRDHVDALPGGDDLAGPGSSGGDLEGSAASAAEEAGGGVQEAVAQRLRLCPRRR
jgi:hypothetical protein